jgi:uncharacterized membrane protein YoaK (UPF0700 family)
VTFVADGADRASDDCAQSRSEFRAGLRLMPHVRTSAGAVKNGRREVQARIAIDARPVDEHVTGNVGRKAEGGIGHATPYNTVRSKPEAGTRRMRTDAIMRVAVGPFYALSLAAGCVDAISFVGFGQVFTANMTGNMVLLGIAVVSHFGTLPVTIGYVYPLIAIVAFIAGALAPLPLFPHGLHARRAGAVVFGEGVLAAIAAIAFALFHAPFVLPLCIALISFAMGAQSMVASKAGLPGISTTYVTGTLITALTRGLSHGASDEHRRDAVRNVWVIVAYIGGASLGALLFIALHRKVLILLALAFAAIGFWLDRKAFHEPAAQPAER